MTSVLYCSFGNFSHEGDLGFLVAFGSMMQL